MTTTQIIFAVLALFGGAFSALAIYMVQSIKQSNRRNAAVMKGVQALLRSMMISEYDKWSAVRYAPLSARENFENCWVQYHNLGANGVMDDIHNKFMELPLLPPQ